MNPYFFISMAAHRRRLGSACGRSITPSDRHECNIRQRRVRPVTAKPIGKHRNATMLVAAAPLLLVVALLAFIVAGA